jgi:hypothetical protein
MTDDDYLRRLFLDVTSSGALSAPPFLVHGSPPPADTPVTAPGPGLVPTTAPTTPTVCPYLTPVPRTWLGALMGSIIEFFGRKRH